MTVPRLAPDQLEELADLVADRIRGGGGAHEVALVDVATVAGYLGVDADWVYAHASELGARRLGTGARPRLRFSLTEVDERLTTCPTGRESKSPASGAVERKAHLRRRTSSGSGVELLPIRARRGAA
jgi:hypothetical protein